MPKQLTPLNSGNASVSRPNAATGSAVTLWIRGFEKEVTAYNAANEAWKKTIGTPLENAACDAVRGNFLFLLAKPCPFPEAVLHKVRFLTQDPELPEWLGHELETFRIFLSSLLCLQPHVAASIDLLNWIQPAPCALAELRAFDTVLSKYVSALASLEATLGADYSEDEEETLGRAVDDAFDKFMAFPCVTTEVVVGKARHLLTSREHADEFFEFPAQVRALIASFFHLKGDEA